MRELRGWYLERLPARKEALEGARQGWLRGDLEAGGDLRRMAHALRGSGATYGFPAISEAARVLEDASDDELGAAAADLIRTLTSAATTGEDGPRSILVVEDDDDQAQYLKVLLEAPGRTFHRARSAAAARQILAEQEISLVILDLVLPDSDGRNLLLEFRERLGTSVIPVVVTTVRSSARIRAECLAFGADEYFEKPLDPEALRRSVDARLASGSEVVRELRKDSATGLANRAAFREAFDRARYVAAVSEEPLSLALIDPDPGTAAEAGELRRLAAALVGSVRGTDLVARWGGEELVALFPRTAREGAASALGKALASLRQASSALGFWAGVAGVREGMGLGEAIAEADRCLSLARRVGKERILSSADAVSCPRQRVLIAEDDELVRLALRRLLEQEGFEVTATEDGAAALDAAQSGLYSLVVSDVRMPRLDGYELLSCLRRMPALSQTPVVLLTAMGSEQDIARGLDLGADDYIVKPFSSVELAARLRRLLKKGAS